MEKYRIKEQIWTNRTEFYPQVLILQQINY